MNRISVFNEKQEVDLWARQGQLHTCNRLGTGPQIVIWGSLPGVLLNNNFLVGKHYTAQGPIILLEKWLDGSGPKRPMPCNQLYRLRARRNDQVTQLIEWWWHKASATIQWNVSLTARCRRLRSATRKARTERLVKYRFEHASLWPRTVLWEKCEIEIGILPPVEMPGDEYYYNQLIINGSSTLS